MKGLFPILFASCCALASGAWAQTPSGEDTVLVTWRDLKLMQSDYQAALLGIPRRTASTSSSTCSGSRKC